MGAGIVVGGRLVRGHRGAAGEMAVLGAHAEEHGAEGISYLARRMGADAVGSGAASAPAGAQSPARATAGNSARTPSGSANPSRTPSAAGVLERLVGGDPA